MGSPGTLRGQGAQPLLRRLVALSLALLLAVASPALALAQAPGRVPPSRIVASGALEEARNRVLSLNLMPTADGRAVGTLRYVDHEARLRVRAQRIESLRVGNGVTTVVATATVGRVRGNRLVVELSEAGVGLEVSGPAGAYRAEGELVGGVTRLPVGARRAVVAAQAGTLSPGGAVPAVGAVPVRAGVSAALPAGVAVAASEVVSAPAASSGSPVPAGRAPDGLASTALALVQQLEVAQGAALAGTAPVAAPTVPAPTPPPHLSPASQVLLLLGSRMAEDPELAGPVRAIAAELGPLLAEEAGARPEEAQMIGAWLEAAVAAAQRERGPGTDVAFAALVDRARAWRQVLGPDGVDQRVARELFVRYRSFGESWARAAAAAAAEGARPDAWAAAAALGISLLDDASATAGGGRVALAGELTAGGRSGRDALSPLGAAGSLPLDGSAGPRRSLSGERAPFGTTTSARLGESDFAIPDGHFFTQTGRPGRAGFAVADQDGVPFWSAFQQLGGVPVLGYPASHRFQWDGFTVQVFQRAILQWRPERGEVYLVNVLDRLHDGGLDRWLLHARQTPAQLLRGGDPFELDAYPALRDVYASGGPAVHGLPTSRVVDMGNHYALRTQRSVLQQWKQDVPWAARGEITVALAGDIVKESGLLPDAWALEPLPWIERG